MYLAIVIIVVLIIAWFAMPCHESFTDGPKGAFYSERDLGGTRTDVAAGQRVVLHEQTFRVWSCDTKGMVIKVTADGLPYMLHLRAGRVDNLPAALGGLPAHENYTGIFNSGRRVMIELVPVEQAQQEVDQGRSYCINNLKFSTEVCGEEFAPL
jgi:hypothetical protein